MPIISFVFISTLFILSQASRLPQIGDSGVVALTTRIIVQIPDDGMFTLGSTPTVFVLLDSVSVEISTTGTKIIFSNPTPTSMEFDQFNLNVVFDRTVFSSTVDIVITTDFPPELGALDASVVRD
mmetsp:Transcript_19559/g.21750  ORF Transcript_19559/g.21750 Transcript_19559/m.21750 type:complete len:125 (+) Transcript_19559:62-436(+)